MTNHGTPKTGGSENGAGLGGLTAVLLVAAVLWKCVVAVAAGAVAVAAAAVVVAVAPSSKHLQKGKQ